MMASFPSQGRPIVDSPLDHYKQALAKDASFAPAYAGIADLYLAVERNVGVAPKFGPDLLDQAKTSAERALDLDPLLSEAHSSMGSIDAREYAWKDAEHHFRHAIELNPTTPWRIGTRIPRAADAGASRRGLAEVGRAVRLDPLSPYVTTESGRALFWARRYDAAIDQLRIAIALEPNRARPYGVLARALSAQGKTGEAMAVFEDAVRRGALLAHLANGDLTCVVARAGRPDAVAAMLQRQVSNPVANIVARLYTSSGCAARPRVSGAGARGERAELGGNCRRSRFGLVAGGCAAGHVASEAEPAVNTRAASQSRNQCLSSCCRSLSVEVTSN